MMQISCANLYLKSCIEYLIAKDAVKDISLWVNKRIVANLCVSTSEKVVVCKSRVGEFKGWLIGNE